MYICVYIYAYMYICIYTPIYIGIHAYIIFIYLWFSLEISFLASKVNSTQ